MPGPVTANENTPEANKHFGNQMDWTALQFTFTHPIIPLT
jgi:hypothetical protein